MAELRGDLTLDTSDGEQAIERLGPLFDQIVAGFSVDLGRALDQLTNLPPIEIDTSGVTQATGEVADQAGSQLADALTSGAAEGAGELASVLAGALGSVESSIVVDADTAGAQAALSALEAEVQSASPAIIDLEVQTSEVTTAVEDLGSASGDTTGDIAGLGAAVGRLGAAQGLATGSAAGLGAAVGEIGEGASLGVATVAALAAGAALFFGEAVEATGASQRFTATLGDQADAVENLDNIQGLNTNLGDLALTLGSDDDRIREVAARLFELANASGIAEGDASNFTQQMIALGARAVALNPNLGDVGDVTDALGTAMVKGGRFAAKYGLDLNAADINTRALEDSGKASADQLTFVERAMAGAAIASEKYGGNLETIVAQGSENAITKQRRLKQTIVENIEALGLPLVAPIFEVLEKGVPIAEDAGRVILALAQAGLPILTVALDIAAPLLEAFADGLEAIGPSGIQAALAVFAVIKLLDNAQQVLKAVTTAASANPWVLLAVGITTVIGALGIFGSSTKDAEAQTQELTDAIIANNGALDENSVKTLRNQLEKDNQTDDLRRAGVSFDEYTAAIESASEATEKQIDGLKRLAAAQALGGLSGRAFVDAIKTVSPELGTLASQLQRNGELNDGLRAKILNQALAMAEATEKTKERTAIGATDADVTGQQADAAQEEADARDAASQALSAYKTNLDALISPQLGLLSAETQLAGSAQRVAEAFAKQADESTSATEIERSRTEALISQTNSAISLAGATYQNVAATQGQDAAAKAADETMRSFASTLRDQLTTQLGFSTEAADAMLEKLGLAQFVGPPASDALAAIAQAAKDLGLTSDSSAAEIEAALARIKDSARTNSDAAADAVESGGQRIAGAATSAGQDALSGFQGGISGMPGVAGGTVLDSVNAAALAGANAHNVGYGIGTKFSSGIGDGITANEAYVSGAGEDLVAALVRAVKRAAEIRSPSKVFAELGGEMGAGLALGLGESDTVVDRAGQRLTMRAIRGADDPALTGGSSSVDNSFNVGGIIVNGLRDPEQAAGAAVRRLRARSFFGRR